MSAIIAPGATVGVLGSGQLGRMFAIAARRMGYRVHTFSPAYDTPTGQVSDLEVQGEYQDVDAVTRFARQVDVITFEFENVPATAIDAAARFAPVRPSGEVLLTTQHRIREKTFLLQGGFPVTPFRPVHDLAGLKQAVIELGLPAILKTAAWGYDGKGQVLIREAQDLSEAWRAIGQVEALLEAFVDFEQEVSVVAGRSLDGQFVHYGLVANQHVDHILDITLAPADVPPTIERQAVEIAEGVMRELDVVGVMCVEFFLTKDQRILINELAPRPHNSGHFTFDACVTSQFEQQLRAVCGLRLGAPTLLRPAAMKNLLGDLWLTGVPDWEAVCSCPDVKLHLYGKSCPRAGRKMGHLTALGDTPAQARQRLQEAQLALIGNAESRALERLP